MSVKDHIGSYKVSNLGGTRASRGFSYQNHWSIKKMIDLHMTGRDYVMLFEVYDDISVLDSESDPRKLEIYQVKSSQNQLPITLPYLCRPDKDEPSILAKLLLIKQGLPMELSEIVGSLNIVSNSSYKCRTSFHSSAVAPISLLDHYSKEVYGKIKNLSKQTGLEDVDIEGLLQITFLIKSPLSFEEPDRQIRDLLQEFFRKHFENFDFDVVPFYQQLLCEVENRCNADKGEGYEETIKSKTLTKRWFDDVLKKIRPDSNRQLKAIIVDLQKEGWASERILVLEDAWRQMEINNLHDKDFYNGKILNAIDELIPEINSIYLDYGVIAEEILRRLKVKYSTVCEDKTNYYLIALILCQTLNYREKVLES